MKRIIAGASACVFLMCAAMAASAQGVDYSGPNVPKNPQNDNAAQHEINRLRAIIIELEREISTLKSRLGEQSTPSAAGNLAGTWLGNVMCGRRQFTITFAVTEQIGRIGKGKWSYTGFATGTDEAQISPMPTPESPDSYTIVTSKPNTYDYLVKLDGNSISGKATRLNCQIYLERG